jgi:hypothetical protein
MCGLRFILLLALIVVLGGCASSSTTGVCARASDVSRESAWPSFQEPSLRHKKASAEPYRTPRDVAVARTAKDETPEPRFTSTEWWMRENARLSRAIIICQDCFPAAIATVAPSKPAVLPQQHDLQALSSESTNSPANSIAADAPAHP